MARAQTRLPEPSSVHNALIRHWLEKCPMAERNSFCRKLREAIVADGDLEDDELEDAVPPVRPDAFIIDRERKEVIVFEVEVTHRVSAERMIEYTVMAMYLNDIGYGATLAIISRHNALTEIDLYGTFLERLRERAVAAPSEDEGAAA